MPKFDNVNVLLELTPEQIEAIDWFMKNPPKYGPLDLFFINIFIQKDMLKK